MTSMFLDSCDLQADEGAEGDEVVDEDVDEHQEESHQQGHPPWHYLDVTFQFDEPENV